MMPASEPGEAPARLDPHLPVTGSVRRGIEAGTLSPAGYTLASDLLVSDAIDDVALFGAFMTPGSGLPPARELVVADLGTACLCGSDGVIAAPDGLIGETVQHIAYWEPDSLVRDFAQCASLSFRDDADLSVRDESGHFFAGHAGSWRNYAHWLCEGLPRLAAYTLLRPQHEGMRIVLPPFRPGSFQQQTLDLIGIGEGAVYRIPHRRVVRFERLNAVFGIDIWSVNPFLDFAAKLLAGRQALAAPGLSGAGPRIYIHRGRGAVRRVANFAEIEPVLTRHGFATLVFDEHPLAQQIAIMREARHIIAEHGAGAANIMFCQPGARVLELFSPMTPQPGHRAVAACCNLRYGFLAGTHHATKAAPEPGWNTDYRIDPAKLDRALATLCETGTA